MSESILGKLHEEETIPCMELSLETRALDMLIYRSLKHLASLLTANTEELANPPRTQRTRSEQERGVETEDDVHKHKEGEGCNGRGCQSLRGEGQKE